MSWVSSQYLAAKKRSAADGKRLTVYNYRRSHEAYLRKQKFTKQQKIERAKKAILKDYKLTEQQFKSIRKENRDYSKNDLRPFVQYDFKIDKKTNDWSPERVGYILAYNEVFVHYETVKGLTGAARVKAINRHLELMENYKLAATAAGAIPYIYEAETIVSKAA